MLRKSGAALATILVISFTAPDAVRAQGGVIVSSPVQANDPFGPDQDLNAPADNDPSPAGKPGKPMRDPAIGVVQGLEGPVFIVAFSDGSYASAGGPPPAPRVDYTVGFARSFDFGDSWVMHDIARGPTGMAEPGALAPPPGTPFSSQWLPVQKRPTVTTGGNGSIHFVGENWDDFNSPTDTSIWIATSTDVGTSFTTRTVAYTTTDNVSYLRPSVAADPRTGQPQDYVYVTWTEFSTLPADSQIMLAVSADGGLTFGAPVAISSVISPPFRSQHVASRCAVGRDGTLYVVWFEPGASGNPNFPDQYVMRAVTAGGTTFDPPLANPPRQITEVRGPSINTLFPNCYGLLPQVGCMVTSDYQGIGTAYVNYPSVATGRAGCQESEVYVAYVQEDEQLGVTQVDMNLYIASSYDNGATWSTPMLAHSPNANLPGHDVSNYGSPSDYGPGLGVTDAGHVGVSYFSTQDDITATDSTPIISNQDYVAYMAYSGDSGATMNTEFPIEDIGDPTFRISLPRQTDDSSNSYWFSETGMTEYNSVIGHGHTFLPVWMTLRGWVLENDDPNWETERHDSFHLVGDILGARAEILDCKFWDYDFDCDIDLSDFAQFSLCFGGANNPPPASCPEGIDADFDNDGDVDLSDFSEFSLCFSGGASAPAGGGESSSPSAGASTEIPAEVPDNPSSRELYRRLQAYCEANGIPCT